MMLWSQTWVDPHNLKLGCADEGVDFGARVCMFGFGSSAESTLLETNLSMPAAWIWLMVQNVVLSAFR